MSETSPTDSSDETTFARFTWRTVAAHVTTYSVAGILAFNLVGYGELWESEYFTHMRSLESPWIAAGPALQIVRGLLFAAVLYPFRRVFLRADRGWLKLWALLVVVGVLSTYGPAPGSVEGLIYTKIPVTSQLLGLPEVLLQPLLFSLALVGWYRTPHPAWKWIFGVGTVLAIASSLAGIFLAPLAN